MSQMVGLVETADERASSPHPPPPEEEGEKTQVSSGFMYRGAISCGQVHEELVETCAV